MAAVTAMPTVPTTSSAPSPLPPRSGTIRDTGTVRRSEVRATAWTVTGLAKVQGDVEVETGTVDGLLSVAGRISAGSLRVRGTLSVVGVVEVRGDLTADGTLQFGTGLHAGSLVSKGSLRSGAPLRVDRLASVTGTVEAPTVSAALVELSGSAEVPGELTAVAAVRARFRGDSRIGTVRAARVELHGPPTSLIPTLWRAVFGGRATIHVDRVEADSVELSAVEVGFVRSPSVVLGPGAHVTAVEGTVVKRHPTSRVGPESRSPPPYGLSR